MCKTDLNMEYKGEESVEDKLGRVTRYMEHIRDIGTTSKKEELNLIKRRIVQIVSELEDIKEDLVNLVRDQLSPRQLTVLLEPSSEDDVDPADTDPSIQFFGVEWNSVFARCFSLGFNIRIFRQRQRDGFVDVTGLACLLSDLSWVRRQMELHSVAFTSGAMSASNIARQLQLQLAVSQAGEEKRMRSGVVRYGRKHKTENLTRQIRQCEEARRNSVCLESTTTTSTPRKKSSFLGNVSSLLSYVKKN